MIDPREYGEAIFLLTEEKNTTEKVLLDLKEVEKLLKENPEYINLADTPALPTEERTGLIDKAFSQVDEDLVSLLKILSEKHSLCAFSRVASNYYALYDESRNIERVTAVTAVPLSENQENALREKLSSATGKNIIIINVVDTSILGGVKLRYQGIQLDGTLRANLNRLEEKIKDAKLF